MARPEGQAAFSRTLSSVFLDSVAKRILSCHARAPSDLCGADLRRAILLVPNHHVAQPVAEALSAAANLPALLLPQMVTLNDWAQSVPLDAPVVTDSQRGALLYQHLRKQQWFGQADLWSMTQELLALFDELTYSFDTLPRDAEAFAAAVQQAYQARHNATLQLEARLVFELWPAMQAGAELDVARAYQQRLAKLAAQASQPLFVLRASEWDAIEQHFLDEYAKRAAVEVFDLREMAPQWSGLLHIHSTGHPTGHPAGLRSQPIPPLGGRLRFFAATSLEQEARAAAMQVRRWLN